MLFARHGRCLPPGQGPLLTVQTSSKPRSRLPKQRVPRTGPDAGAAIEVPRAAILAAAIAALALAFAPAASNAFWGINPWASLTWTARIALIAAAAAAGVLGVRFRGGTPAVLLLSATLGWTLAFP